MLAVNDLFYLAKPIVENLFYGDVVAWLDANDIRYTPSVKFTGISGYDQHFDFAIPKSKKQPERIVQAINRPTRESALLFINAWSDTRQVRAPESRHMPFSMTNSRFLGQSSTRFVITISGPCRGRSVLRLCWNLPSKNLA